MPSISEELTDIEQTVTRPVVMEIMDQVFAITSLSKDTEIFYNRVNGPHQTAGTSIDAAGQKEARFTTDRATYIEVTETDDLRSIQEMITFDYDEVPVFEDRALMCSLRPIYSTVDVSIAIKYRSNSENETKRWMAAMKVKVARGRDLNLHSVKYTYAVPIAFLEILEEVHKRRESVSPYGDSFEKYLSNHATDRLTILTNRAGEKGALAVTERQSRIQGLFDFSGLPERPTYDNGTGMWEVAFTYKFSYQKPESMYIDYPTMVHNQLMPEKLLAYIHRQEDPLYQKSYNNRTYRALSMFQADSQSLNIRREETYIRLPDFDDFKPEELIPNTSTIILSLCEVEEDKRTLLNLRELGDYCIDPDILDHLPLEAPYMTRVMKSLFHVSLYRNGRLAPDGILEVTDDLTIKATQDLDLRKTHHVRFSLMSEVSVVMKEAIDRVIQSPRAFLKVLAALNESLRDDPDFNQMKSRGHIEPYELSDLYYYMTGHHYGNQYAPSLPAAPNGWYGTAAWPGIEDQSFLDCVDVVAIRRYYREKEPEYYRLVTSNLAPTDKSDEVMVDRFYKDRRRRKPSKNCSNVPYVTSIDRERMDKFLGEKRRQRLTVMTTGVIAMRKDLLDGSKTHPKPV